LETERYKIYCLIRLNNENILYVNSFHYYTDAFDYMTNDYNKIMRTTYFSRIRSNYSNDWKSEINLTDGRLNKWDIIESYVEIPKVKYLGN